MLALFALKTKNPRTDYQQLHLANSLFKHQNNCFCVYFVILKQNKLRTMVTKSTFYQYNFKV